MFDNNIDELDDFFSGGGAPGLKFPTQNQWNTGTIVKVEIKTQIDMVTQQPKIDERSGKPKQMCVVTILTDLRDPEITDDDGVRRQFYSGNMLFELKNALREQGVRKPQIGARTATAWTGSKKSNFPQPQKLYTVKYQQPTAESLAAAHAWLESQTKASFSDDPFNSPPVPSSAPLAGRATLDSMRASEPFSEEAPF